MAEEAWKVVHKAGGCLWSAKVNDALVMCKYGVKRWTDAPLGGLLCFSTQDAAISFQHEQECDSYILETWRVDASAPVSLPPLAFDSAYSLWGQLSPSEVIRIVRCAVWVEESFTPSQRRSVRQKGVTLIGFRWPPGTVAYKRVRLVEKVL